MSFKRAGSFIDWTLNFLMEYICFSKYGRILILPSNAVKKKTLTWLWFVILSALI
uniref:Uncharacterized protein n=1 Tax=Arundo donax TaxID=35708 RepID=A0A0A9BKP7_ARUDO